MRNRTGVQDVHWLLFMFRVLFFQYESTKYKIQARISFQLCPRLNVFYYLILWLNVPWVNILRLMAFFNCPLVTMSFPMEYSVWWWCIEKQMTKLYKQSLKDIIVKHIGVEDTCAPWWCKPEKNGTHRVKRHKLPFSSHNHGRRKKRSWMTTQFRIILPHNVRHHWHQWDPASRKLN